MALEGTLNYLDIAYLLQVVGTSKKSGVLEITWQDREARLFFDRGRLIRAESNRFHEGIGTLLVQAGLLTPQHRDKALASQRAEGGVRRLGALLCDEYRVQPEEIERVLRCQFERVVYDVFSWPGGAFVFRFQAPDAVMDRFGLNPAEFILGVGIQAGLLAQEGVERERRGEHKASLLLLLQDRQIAEQCAAYWQRKGHPVTHCEGEDQVLEKVKDLGPDQGRPVVVTDLVRPAQSGRGLLGGFELLSRIRALGFEVPVVVLGDSTDPRARVAARSRGASAYVKKPSPEDLGGAHGQVHIDVFLMTLHKAVEMAIAALGAPRREIAV